MYQKFFYSEFTNQLCSDRRWVELMLEVELALIKAQEQNDIIPKGTAARLKIHLQNIQIDHENLREQIPLTGNAAAPLVKYLVSALKKENEEAAEYLHLGATSQDIVDTATILKTNHFLRWLHEKLILLENILIDLTEQHRFTLMMGRTLMQQARPISFGLKTAGWLQAVRSAKIHLASAEDQLLYIQLGASVGAENQYLNKEIRASFAKILGLKNGPNWHTQRTNIAAFASALAILSGSLGKIARDVVLLSQTEVGEVSEPATPGRGTSSTLPHKRNPVLSIAVLANAHRTPFLVASLLAAMPQELERAAGLWQSEWETLDDILGLTAGAMEKAIELLEGLEVNKERMLANIKLSKGLIFAEPLAFALAGKMGKQSADDLIKKACQKAVEQNRPLREILDALNLDLSKEELDQLFKPENAIGNSLEIIDEILEKT